MSAQRAIDGPSVGQIAADEYRLRSANALRKVAAGDITRAQAAHLIAPWTAIVLLARTPIEDLPDHVAAQLADLRKCIVHYRGDGTGPVWNHQLDEDEARVLLATDICGPNVWGPTLSNARDAALARADSPERIERARNLCRLARALDVPLTLASCAAPGGTVPAERIAA